MRALIASPASRSASQSGSSADRAQRAWRGSSPSPCRGCGAAARRAAPRAPPAGKPCVIPWPPGSRRGASCARRRAGAAARRRCASGTSCRPTCRPRRACRARGAACPTSIAIDVSAFLTANVPPKPQHSLGVRAARPGRSRAPPRSSRSGRSPTCSSRSEWQVGCSVTRCGNEAPTSSTPSWSTRNSVSSNTRPTATAARARARTPTHDADGDDHRVVPVEHPLEALRPAPSRARRSPCSRASARSRSAPRGSRPRARAARAARRRPARRREQRVVEAGDEEGDAHAGRVCQRGGLSRRWGTAKGGGAAMYKQVLDPVGDSLFAERDLRRCCRWSTLFVLLGGLKLKAHWRRAGRAGRRRSWSRSIVYSMPVGQALDAGLRGRRVRPVPDHVDRLERDLDLQHDRGRPGTSRCCGARSRAISDDQRIQAVIIAFSLRRAARGAGRLRHAGGDHRRDAGRRSASSRSRRPRSRSWPTPRRSRSARSRSRSSRSPGSPSSRRRTSARWSAARRRSWRCSCR